MRAVNLENVNFIYEGAKTKALDDVSFYLDYGRVTLLSGTSGSGKSTLMSVVCGIVPHVINGEITGKATVAGKDITKLRLSQICRLVGVVLQNADAQIIHNTVEDEVAFGCENFAMSAEQIKKSIEGACNFMELDPKWNTRTLSGGQKQKLITACTLATRQRIIILDEPLANLDKQGAKLLMQSLQKLATAGYAVLITEHRLDMVMKYVDDVWHMQEAKVCKVQDKEEYLKKQSVEIEDYKSYKDSNIPLFKVKDIAFRVANRDILKGVNFQMNKGDRLVILGENGCGKTTLSRIIARLQKPDSGSVEQFIDSKLGNIKPSKKWFKKVGIVYQNPNYQLFMPTVLKEIAFNAKSMQFAKQIMCDFGLQDLANRSPQSLSEGQKRLLSIACVCAGEPEVLILDEPTVGQDYEGLKRLIYLIAKYCEKTNVSIITVTHDKRCAKALCDKAILLKDGIITEYGGKELIDKYFKAV